MGDLEDGVILNDIYNLDIYLLTYMSSLNILACFKFGENPSSFG